MDYTVSDTRKPVSGWEMQTRVSKDFTNGDNKDAPILPANKIEVEFSIASHAGGGAPTANNLLILSNDFNKGSRR
jgi:hypothetical protein